MIADPARHEKIYTVVAAAIGQQPKDFMMHDILIALENCMDHTDERVCSLALRLVGRMIQVSPETFNLVQQLYCKLLDSLVNGLLNDSPTILYGCLETLGMLLHCPLAMRWYLDQNLFVPLVKAFQSNNLFVQ